MTLIRKGVKLRSTDTTEPHPCQAVTPSDRHAEQLREVLNRIKMNCQSSDSEDDYEDTFEDD